MESGVEAKVITEDNYRKQMALPVYFMLTTDAHSHMRGGNRYYVVVDNPATETQHWLHEAICVGVTELGTVDNVPPTLLAFVTETRSEEEALDRIKKYTETQKPIKLAVMMRIDTAQEFVVEGLDSIQTVDNVAKASASIDEEYSSDKNTAVIRNELES